MPRFMEGSMFCYIFILLLHSSVNGLIHIEGRPQNQEVVEGERTRIVCKTASDPFDNSQLLIRWLIRGQKLNLTTAPENKYLRKSDRNRHALIIKNVQQSDSGKYTCVATIGLDSDEASATLTVKSRPNPPQHVEIRALHGNSAELVWIPGAENGAEITHYLLQFNTSSNQNVWYDYYEEIPGTKLHYSVDLAPWGTYSFRLLARNIYGLSDPSKLTDHTLTTPPDRPDRNPKDVVTPTHKKLYLVIEWTPMPRLEYHGPNFRYHVYWRQKGNIAWQEDIVQDPTLGHFERDVDEIFQVFEVQVKAENELGEAHQPAFTFQGRSGESEPLLIPRDFRKDPSRPIEAHNAYFIWEAVEQSEKVRGVFQGYRLQYWKSSEGRHKKKEVDVTVTRTPLDENPVVRAAILNLPAITALRAQVAVRNSNYVGPASVTIDFLTPEGAPSAVRSLEKMEIKNRHVLLKWLPPEQPNGHLLGFDIGYQSIEAGEIGEIRNLKPAIADPSKLSARITGLLPQTQYRFVVWARTKAGRGKMAMVDVQTQKASKNTSFLRHGQSNGSQVVLPWLVLLLTSPCLAYLIAKTATSFTFPYHNYNLTT